MAATQLFPGATMAVWRDLVMPKEHGSWSLAFEPIALGLLCAPSPGGAWLALGVAAGFFCRRPLRIAWCDHREERRRAAGGALARCAAIATIATGVAVAMAGPGWLVWLMPSAILGALFLRFDLRNGGREEAAEVAGTMAFALLPAAFATIGGWSAYGAIALGLVMLSRALPTVIFVRAAVRGRKQGCYDFRRAFFSAALALLVTSALAGVGHAPVTPAILCAVLLARVALLAREPGLPPKMLGMLEAAAGVAFVLLTGIAWRT